MSFGAKIHKCGFEAGLNASHFAFVDICFFLDSGSVFDVEVIQTLSINEGNAKFFFLRCIDKHSFH